MREEARDGHIYARKRAGLPQRRHGVSRHDRLRPAELRLVTNEMQKKQNNVHWFKMLLHVQKAENFEILQRKTGGALELKM